MRYSDGMIVFTAKDVECKICGWRGKDYDLTAHLKKHGYNASEEDVYAMLRGAKLKKVL
jgi:hypothetical protein